MAVGVIWILKRLVLNVLAKDGKFPKEISQDIVNQQNPKHARQFKVESLQATEMLIKAKTESLSIVIKLTQLKIF